MKALLSFLFVTLMAIVSYAEVKTPVSEIDAVKFDGRKLQISYRMGGGCQSHTGRVEFDFNKEDETVSMRVFDVTPVPDRCEAYIAGKVEVDLKSEVAALLTMNGYSEGSMWRVKVVLPTVVVLPYEPNAQ